MKISSLHLLINTHLNKPTAYTKNIIDDELKHNQKGIMTVIKDISKALNKSIKEQRSKFSSTNNWVNKENLDLLEERKSNMTTIATVQDFSQLINKYVKKRVYSTVLENQPKLFFNTDTSNNPTIILTNEINNIRHDFKLGSTNIPSSLIANIEDQELFKNTFVGTKKNVLDFFKPYNLNEENINFITSACDTLEGTILTSSEYTSLAEEVLEDCNTGLDQKMINENWETLLANKENLRLQLLHTQKKQDDKFISTYTLLNNFKPIAQQLLEDQHPIKQNSLETFDSLKTFTKEILTYKTHLIETHIYNQNLMSKLEKNNHLKNNIMSYDLSSLKKGDKISVLLAESHIKKVYPASTKQSQIALGTVEKINYNKNKEISSVRMKPFGSSETILVKPDENKLKPIYKSQNFDSRELHFPIKGKSYEELKPEIQPLLFGNKTNLLTDVKGKNKDGESINYDAKFQLARDYKTGLPKLYEFKKNNTLRISDTIGNTQLSENQIASLKAGNTILLENVKLNNKGPQNLYIEVDKSLNTLAFLNQKAVNLPTQLHGVSLNDQQKKDLAQGKKIEIVGIESKDNKTKFNASIKVSPSTGRFQYDKKVLQKIEKQKETKKTIDKGVAIKEEKRNTVRRSR